jgi:hypothetical protein
LNATEVLVKKQHLGNQIDGYGRNGKNDTKYQKQEYLINYNHKFTLTWNGCPQDVERGKHTPKGRKLLF